LAVLEAGVKSLARTVILRVEGMHCGACVTTVEKALRDVPGVVKVRVSLLRKRARVKGTADPEELVTAVRNSGYESRLLSLE
jgi:copper chaperone CopZ